MYNICSNCGCAVRSSDSLCPACGGLVIIKNCYLSDEPKGNINMDVYTKLAEQIIKESQESNEKRNQAMVTNFALNYGGMDFADLEELMEKEELLRQKLDKYGW